MRLLEDILLIGLISVICGAERGIQMVEVSNLKEDFLRIFLELPNDIPSDDTINRVFSSIESSQFKTCYRLSKFDIKTFKRTGSCY